MADWLIDGTGLHKPTNADRIRAMSDAELEEFIKYVIWSSSDAGDGVAEIYNLDWLQAEAEG